MGQQHRALRGGHPHPRCELQPVVRADARVLPRCAAPFRLLESVSVSVSVSLSLCLCCDHDYACASVAASASDIPSSPLSMYPSLCLFLGTLQHFDHLILPAARWWNGSGLPATTWRENLVGQLTRMFRVTHTHTHTHTHRHTHTHTDSLSLDL